MKETDSGVFRLNRQNCEFCSSQMTCSFLHFSRLYYHRIINIFIRGFVFRLSSSIHSLEVEKSFVITSIGRNVCKMFRSISGLYYQYDHTSSVKYHDDYKMLETKMKQSKIHLKWQTNGCLDFSIDVIAYSKLGFPLWIRSMCVNLYGSTLFRKRGNIKYLCS